MANDHPGRKRVDEATGTRTVGHEWDGIEELDTPMPRWWLLTLYATIVVGLVLLVLYPAIPLVHQATSGALGWSSRGQLAQEMAKAEEGKAPLRQALAATPMERLPEDSELLRAAVAGGRAAYLVNCVQCHGAGAAGSKGYPNLNDDSWLWGGDLKAIEYTLVHGIRQPGHDETRTSLMPAFGEILSSQEVAAVADHVLSLGGKGRGSAAGAKLYADNCAACHGPQGTGSRELGAPNLADAIWLYGGSRDEVIRQVAEPRHGVMPAWGGRLDPVTIKMLAAYVHSLGGGEDFVEVAQDPAVEVDEQP